MSVPNAAELFAVYAAGVRYEDIPRAAIERAKVFILDSLGVGIAGSSAPGRSEILAAARRWGVGEEVSLWGGGGKLPAPAAAMLNAFQMHCQEYDCVCEPAVLHPMATLLPAALAYAEREGGISGKQLLAAVAVGVDVSGWIGIASTQPLALSALPQRAGLAPRQPSHASRGWTQQASCAPSASITRRPPARCRHMSKPARLCRYRWASTAVPHCRRWILRTPDCPGHEATSTVRSATCR